MSETNGQPKRMALIASKGTLDWAYPPFILASTAAAMEMEVGIFLLLWTDASEEEYRGKSSATHKSGHAHEDAVWAERVSGFRMAHAEPADGQHARFRDCSHVIDEEDVQEQGCGHNRGVA